MKRKKIRIWDLTEEYRSGKRKKSQKRTCNGCALTRWLYTVAYMEKAKMHLGNSDIYEYDKASNTWYCELSTRVDIDKNIPLEPCFKPRSKREAHAAHYAPCEE